MKDGADGLLAFLIGVALVAMLVVPLESGEPAFVKAVSMLVASKPGHP
ncbi:MAG: hypothetical protein KIT18_12185 [Burkholderiales bacterium]|nr:hypothetical protein [Burkholderiales bacterium]